MTKVVQTVYGVDSQGNRDVLGLYVEAHEGALQLGFGTGMNDAGLKMYCFSVLMALRL